MKYTYVTDYKENEKLRKSFHKLTEKIYGFNLENWYLQGFWGDSYSPHSLLDGDKIVANVSANIMEFELDGRKKHYIQIGTVMTDPNYCGQGLSRFLMKKVLDQYKDVADGFYLFANDSVLNFYPKFGFRKCPEYRYRKQINSSYDEKTIEHIDFTDDAKWNKFYNTVKNSISNDRFYVYNSGLMAFWTRESGSVYYQPEEGAYVIAEINGDQLFIQQIIADHKVSLNHIIQSFGKEVKQVILGFTPYESDGFSVQEYKEENSTLFILGDDLKEIEEKKLLFPTLSHA